MDTKKLVFPLSIPTPFEIGEVYSYLIRDEKIVLIDVGPYTSEAHELLRKHCSANGLSLHDIDEIWLTHGHPDHFGQAAMLAEKYQIDVLGHPGERLNFAGNSDRGRFNAFFAKRGIEKGRREMMLSQLDWLQQYQLSIEPEPLKQGRILNTGIHHFEVIFTPGHAPGHISFRALGNVGFTVGGDVLLEHISTNALINFDPDTGKRNKSLLQYRKSLRKMSSLIGTVYPGHGMFVTDPSETASRHLSEQMKRYRLVLQKLANNTCSLFELACGLFPKAIERNADFLALSEVMGYLDWGMEEGKIEMIKTADTVGYRKSDKSRGDER